MTERRNIRLLKHRNEIELSYRNWVSALLELVVALGIAFLGGYYAVFSYLRLARGTLAPQLFWCGRSSHLR
jgi:hypothetical protein